MLPVLPPMRVAFSMCTVGQRLMFQQPEKKEKQKINKTLENDNEMTIDHILLFFAKIDSE